LLRSRGFAHSNTESFKVQESLWLTPKVQAQHAAGARAESLEYLPSATRASVRLCKDLGSGMQTLESGESKTKSHLVSAERVTMRGNAHGLLTLLGFERKLDIERRGTRYTLDEHTVVEVYLLFGGSASDSDVHYAWELEDGSVYWLVTFKRRIALDSRAAADAGHLLALAQSLEPLLCIYSE
jgi:hypothetical protein